MRQKIGCEIRSRTSTRKTFGQAQTRVNSLKVHFPALATFHHLFTFDEKNPTTRTLRTAIRSPTRSA